MSLAPVIVTRRSWHFKFIRAVDSRRAARLERGASTCAYAWSFLVCVVYALAAACVLSIIGWELIILPANAVMHAATGYTLNYLSDVDLVHGYQALAGMGIALAGVAALCLVLYVVKTARVPIPDRWPLLGALADLCRRACRPVKVED